MSVMGTKPLRATHIVGGEIYYDCLGGNNYTITMKMYRDCINGVPPFDNPASIGVFDPITGFLITSLFLSNPTITTISSTISVPCYAPSPGTVCEEEAIYTTTANLPPSANGYLLVYQRCCRNNIIVNLVNPGQQGSTISTLIPPLSVTCNSSPRYNYYPPIYLCVGVPLIFDHSATDPDGDSLAYELCNPLAGADTLNPMPQPPNPPPYSSVNYVSPYNGGNPIGASPPLFCDPITGFITGTPNMLGTWVVAVCCKEYRNGVLINKSLRDFQFTVLPCTPIPVTSSININATALNCTGRTIPFQQNSVNATIYNWNFGDPTTTNDTSNLTTPVYTYPSNGTYTVILTVNPGTICSDTDVVVITVTDPPQVQFSSPSPQCITGNSFGFAVTGVWGASATFNWNFGSNANPSTANTINPSGISYDTSGTFPVSISVNDNGCTTTANGSVLVFPVPEARFNVPNSDGCVPYTVQFSDASITGVPLSYRWFFGDGDSSSLASPTHTYTQTGVYDVMLIVSAASGCIVTDTFFLPALIVVNPTPTAAFSVDNTTVSIFNPYITTMNLSVDSDSCLMNFGDGTLANNCNTTHAYWNYGPYTLTQTVWNAFNCPDTAQLRVIVRPEYRFYVPNTFTPNGDGLNDEFLPAIIGAEEYRFLIFNRWGELLFETNNTKAGWDGRFKGDKCQQDVYVWKIEFRNAETEQQENFIGHVNLIR
jgi:gliding motility-associated-like protein